MSLQAIAEGNDEDVPGLLALSAQLAFEVRREQACLVTAFKTRNISGHLIWRFWRVGAISLILVSAKFCHKNDV